MFNRRSIRLKAYDYSRYGYYFITICTQNKTKIFGEIIKNEMILNSAGKMVRRWFIELETKFPNVLCDKHIIMPDHIHYILQIKYKPVGADLCVCPFPNVHNNVENNHNYNNVENNHNPNNVENNHNYNNVENNHNPNNVEHTVEIQKGEHAVEIQKGEHAVEIQKGEHTGSPLRSLSRIVQWFKTMTTNEYINNVKNCGWVPYDGKLWQRNYYESIIHNKNQLRRIREYIHNNPKNY